MIGKELKKLSRRELVDIIYQMKKNEQQMQEEIASLRSQLQEKRIRISVAGSIAEAAVDITRILATAQTTADLYLQEIACRKAEAEQECAQKMAETEKKVQAVLADGEKQLEDLKARYRMEYQKWQKLQQTIREQACEETENGR